MKWIINFLKIVDYFGIVPSLRINSEDKFKTPLGGSLFLIWIFGIFGFILYSFDILINKKVMTLISSNEIQIPSPQINLTDNKFMWGMALLFENYTVANEAFQDVFEIRATYEKLINQDKDKKVKQRVSMRKCTSEDFKVIKKSEFDSYLLDKYLCPSNINFTNQGVFTNDIYTNLKFDVMLTSKYMKDKKLYDNLRNLIETESLRINVYFVDTSIDVGNR